jgi:hypothetical protein
MVRSRQLIRTAAHETYPGHHTERCCKEETLVRGRGLLEETIVLLPTPQSLVAEGIATLAPRMLLEGDRGPALAAVIHDAGIPFDLAQALDVERAAEPLRWVEANAASMLHERGASEPETHTYLQPWGLMTPALAAHVLRVITDPSARAYIVTYTAGRELCGGYVAGAPEGFRRLLTEQVRVRDLLAANEGGS